ncbi:MAG TPA: hypothetical protein VGN72_00205 [Tepidisphaeraceae bacterium]|jgi:hypothetical protein|nr:hypothetical protein [Tepidisphaeraceae bacterium]
MISVLERISENVLTSLQAITTENGYEIKLDVHRAKAVNEPRHLKSIIHQLSPVEDEESSVMGYSGWLQPYAVVTYVIPLDDDETPIDTYNNQVAMALHKALAADTTRGGLAIDTLIRPMLYFPPVQGEYAGTTAIFDVRYRHILDHPELPASA